MLTELRARMRYLAGRIDGGLVYHRGPVWLNRAGFQVARTLYRNTSWALRSVPVRDELRRHVETLIREGCVTIPDFLPADLFAQVRREYEDSLTRLPYENIVTEPNNAVEEMVDLVAHASDFPVTTRAVFENQTMRAIVAGALRRPIKAQPRAFVKRWYRAATQLKPKGFGHVIGADVLHADVHFPTFKAWFYLNDIDETNGALAFVRGSHRLTVPRIAYEYDASVRVAKRREEGTDEDLDYARLRSPTPKQRAALKLDDASIVGKANTLVIANTQGFHRQGQFAPGAVREAVMFCFRSSEPGFLSG